MFCPFLHPHLPDVLQVDLLLRPVGQHVVQPGVDILVPDILAEMYYCHKIAQFQHFKQLPAYYAT